MLTAAAIHHHCHEELRRLICSFLQEWFHAKRRRELMRRAIREYRDSPFYYLLHSGCQQSMITATGFDYRSFYSLLQVFLPSSSIPALIFLTTSGT
jgi:hypothetical protein